MAFKQALMQQQKMTTCLPSIKAVFVMMLKQQGRLQDFAAFLQSPDANNQIKQDLVKIWEQAGNFIFQLYQKFKTEDPDSISLLETNSRLLASLSVSD